MAVLDQYFREIFKYVLKTKLTFWIFFQDQGNPPQYSDTHVHVNVIDADDQNPKFMDERYSAIVPDQATKVKCHGTLTKP